MSETKEYIEILGKEMKEEEMISVSMDTIIFIKAIKKFFGDNAKLAKIPEHIPMFHGDYVRLSDAQGDWLALVSSPPDVSEGRMAVELVLLNKIEGADK